MAASFFSNILLITFIGPDGFRSFLTFNKEKKVSVLTKNSITHIIVKNITLYVRRYDMGIVDELYQNKIFHVSSEELVHMLQSLKQKKEAEITEVKEKIYKYEKDKRAKEALYQSLSPLRKLFAARPPSHHQAVEYLVHVKERLRKIDKLRQFIAKIDEALRHLENGSFQEEIVLPASIVEQLKIMQETGDQLS